MPSPSSRPSLLAAAHVRASITARLCRAAPAAAPWEGRGGHPHMRGRAGAARGLTQWSSAYTQGGAALRHSSAAAGACREGRAGDRRVKACSCAYVSPRVEAQQCGGHRPARATHPPRTTAAQLLTDGQRQGCQAQAVPRIPAPSHHKNSRDVAQEKKKNNRLTSIHHDTSRPGSSTIFPFAV